MAARALALVVLAVPLAVAVAGLAAADAPSLLPALPALPGTAPGPSSLPGSPSGVDAPGGGGSGAFPGAPELVGPEGGAASSFVVAGLAGLAGLGAFLVWGGTRFRDTEEVLAHEVRSAIYRYVEQHVGASLKDITEHLGLSTTNAVWHLRKLEEGGLVRGRKFNGAKVYYPTSGGVQARNLSLAGAALTSANARQILVFVEGHPGVHQREIARLLGVNHGTVRWHLKKLRKAELLEERRLGPSATYHVSPLGADALRHMASRAPLPEAQPAEAVQSPGVQA
jgi:predicted transcriptional regulator